MPGLRRISSDTAILPMSCMGLAMRISCGPPGSHPGALGQKLASPAHPVEMRSRGGIAELHGMGEATDGLFL